MKTNIWDFCLCFVTVGIIIEIIVMYFIQHRAIYPGIYNIYILLFCSCVPIFMRKGIYLIAKVGSRRLDDQGVTVIKTKAIEELAGMDVLCCDKNGTLTYNQMIVSRSLIEVFAEGVDENTLLVMAARASPVEDQDKIETAIVNTLANQRETLGGIQEVHFLPFNSTDKRTALTYKDNHGKLHCVTKGAPEQILNLVHNKSDIDCKVRSLVEKFTERGFHSVAVAYQEVPEEREDSVGGQWKFIGIIPLYYIIRSDSVMTIKSALGLGVNIKMITGDKLEIAKATGQQIGMGTNMYPSLALLGQNNESSIHSLPIDELIEKADGFSSVFPQHKHEIIKRLQARKHICGTIGEEIINTPDLEKAGIIIAVSNLNMVVIESADIILPEPGLRVIIDAVWTSREIFQRMKYFTIYVVSFIIYMVLAFMILALVWKFETTPTMMLNLIMINIGNLPFMFMDKVKPSRVPDRMKPAKMFATTMIFGGYLAMTTIIFFWVTSRTSFFQDLFGVVSLQLKDTNKNNKRLELAVFLQVSSISQALIFVFRTNKISYMGRPCFCLMAYFLFSQLITTLLAVYAGKPGLGWHWAGVIWSYNIVLYLVLDVYKLFIRTPKGRVLDLPIDQTVY